MCEMDFKCKYTNYRDARKEQQKDIKDKFENMKKSGDDSFGFLVKEVKDRSYPDKNWFGIDVTIEKDGENKKYHIALQAYDKDQGSDNIHVLMDRLGIYEYDRCDNSDLSFDKIEGKMFAAINHYEENKSSKDDNKERNNYITKRREQQKLIADYLEKHNDGKFQFEVITPNNGRGGKGLPIYTNGGGIMPFDNSIWKWLEVVVKDKDDKYPEKIQAAFFISLQSFDKDSDAYVVFDKIGIYQYPPDMIENYNNATEKYKKKQLKTKDAIREMKPTEISLPITEEGVKSIVEKLMSLMEEQQK